jgi:hypothetical protein
LNKALPPSLQPAQENTPLWVETILAI